MQTEDYLMRQINQLGRALGKILANLLGLENKGKVDEEVGIVSQQLKEQLDLDLDEIVRIPTEGFPAMLIKEKGCTNENLNQLADILFIMAENYTGEEEGLRRIHEKCLVIYQFLERSDKVYSMERNERIRYIVSTLSGPPLSTPSSR
jgi:hypothetical protein